MSYMMSLLVDGLLLSAWSARRRSKHEHHTQKDDDIAQWNVESYHPILKEREK